MGRLYRVAALAAAVTVAILAWLRLTRRGDNDDASPNGESRGDKEKQYGKHNKTVHDDATNEDYDFFENESLLRA